MTRQSPLSRKLAGLKAQSAGKAFEAQFETICRQNNFTCIRIPNGCRTIPFKPYLIRTKSPFDFAISHKGFSVYLDVKSTESDSFTYSKLDQAQIRTLNDARKDSLSGYIIHFTTVNKIVFFDVRILKALQPRSSLKIEDGITLGTFGYQCDLYLLKQIKFDQI